MFLAVPAAGWGWLDGVPLGRLEAMVLALVWWAWAARRSLPGTSLLAALTAAKILVALLLVDRGFEARYYANDLWMPPVARSTEFPRAAFTRRDERLSFGVGSAPDLPLHYFNDLRFNFYLPTQPQRDRLGYSVEWTGYVYADPPTTETTYYVATGPGISTVLAIDGRETVATAGASPVSRAVELAGGWHAVTIRARAAYGASRAIEAGELRNGSRRPFDAAGVVAAPVGSARLAVDRVLRWTTHLVDAVLLVYVAVLVMRGARAAWSHRRVLLLLMIGAIGEALLFAGRYAGRTVVLGGGQDWLSYESYARAIALGDVMGAGQTGPFYYQALYPYVIALSHAGFGDGLFGIVLLQRLLLAATVGWVAVMTRHLFGACAGWIAVACGGPFVYAKGGRWTEVLLAEPFFVSLLAGWMTLLITLVPRPGSSARVVAAGIVGGIATLTRSTLLLAWLPILLLWSASLRRPRVRIVVTLIAAMTAVVALLPLRNWIVAGGVTVVPTSFAVNLYMGNTPTRPLDPAPPERQAIYERLGLDPSVRAVSEFALQAPDAFAAGLANKALYVVGLMGWSGLPGESGIARLYIGAWVLAIAGAIRMFRTSVASGAAVWLPAAGALSHAAALVIIFPHGYTDRLILPLYPLLIPYGAYAVESLFDVVPRAAAQLGLILAGAAGITRAWARRYVAPVVATVLHQRRSWLYLAYTAAVVQSPEPASALVLPAAALATIRLTARERMLQAVGGALWALALIRVAAAGSLSAAALYDPLFWGLLAAIALAVSAVARRWPMRAAAAAALAGAFTMVATLLPVVPGFDVGAFRMDVTTVRESMTTLSRQFGLLGALCLLALWIQAIVSGGVRPTPGRIAGAARGALSVALLLVAAGAMPQTGGALWLAGLGTLLGLAERNAGPTVR